ncbi:hypothetical protein B6N60_05030 [Richelia sinica FACHB-800]|uniref:HNH nuclease domain-containing protein n=1 Tax=Richelia sinica FACHB-800 TaxID=1357546 RepID=A0A975TCR2_9NOST|nr:HNH endonuclease signature motif containing protein [Richelia sinica]MBD2663971.1 HNH endonuclease [Richelia sinica FACHB-800]QXE26299.1 hypothetical protein B6N60_05030 [Richelia sinica FACHB-800]
MVKIHRFLQGKKVIKRAKSATTNAQSVINDSAYYSLQPIERLKSKFSYGCAYCGSKESVGLDHFIPVSKGGPDCLVNFIPACDSCNTKKRNLDPKIWYKSQSFYSPQRWQMILEVLGKTESNYNRIPHL